MSEPAVSVIVPCFRAQDTIGLQLEALATQIDAPPFEVILVDNDPEQNLVDAVAPFQQRDAFDLRIVTAHEHQGSSYARNVGISHARADAVQFCDADDVVSRTWVCNGYLTTREVDLWSGQAILLEDEDFTDDLDDVRRAFDAEPPVWRPPVDGQNSNLPVLMGGNFGGARATLLRLRGFDQSFAHRGDDNDLAFRARRAGLRVPTAETVRIAFRGKWSARDRLRLGFLDARARRRMLMTHDAMDQSPVPPWPIDVARCALATVLMPLRRRPAPLGMALRWSYALGGAAGALTYGWPGRRPQSAPGLGLDHNEARRGEP